MILMMMSMAMITKKLFNTANVSTTKILMLM